MYLIHFLIKKENITFKRRKFVPKYTEKQTNELNHNLRRLSKDKFLLSNGLDVMTDTESFFFCMLDGSDIASNRY